MNPRLRLLSRLTHRPVGEVIAEPSGNGGRSDPEARLAGGGVGAPRPHASTEPHGAAGVREASTAPGAPDDGAPAWRLVSTLALAGAIAGLLIVGTFQWAHPRIVEHQAEALRSAVAEVLGAPARSDRLFLYAGALTAELPAGVDTAGVERLFVGYDEAGERIGFAVQGAAPGFQDLVSLIFGYDPVTNRVLGMKVLAHKETPGLGDKIVRDSGFVGDFRGAAPPLVGVKAGTGTGADGEVDLITGATISSRVVVQIIDRRVEAVRPLLERYLEGAVP